VPSKLSIFPLKLVTTTNCSQVKTLVRTTSTQLSFPETVSDSLCRNSLGVQSDSFISSLDGWSQMILQVKKLDVVVMGWCGYTWTAVSKTTLEVYGREMNIKFSVN
jgi:hypothetical protein